MCTYARRVICRTLLFSKGVWHDFLKVKILASTSFLLFSFHLFRIYIINFYTAPHFFFIGFHKHYNKGVNCLYCLQKFLQAYQGNLNGQNLFYILGENVCLLHPDQIQLILLWISLFWTTCHLSANKSSI